MCEWVFIEDRLPLTTKYYKVLWSEPYSQYMSEGFSYYSTVLGRFDNSPAGANEILYWLDDVPDYPDIPREGLRTRRVK